ncbi:MAG TPA: histidine kinase, partial [Coxiellaceae bacterium]|nr:histidine kinase [Coxiellaceae bacterium]
LNKDFTYIGSDLLTKHILFNLIKNSLRAIKEVDRGKIYITLKHDGNFNYLLFKDTGSGISTQILESLFEQFKGNGQDGSGLGLSFCKRTMKSYGGDITCDSKEGEYTEFTLSFPKV